MRTLRGVAGMTALAAGAVAGRPIAIRFVDDRTPMEQP